MAFADYQKNDAWKQAIELSLKISQLSESLPDGDQLAGELMSSAIEIPTMAAEDLIAGHKARMGGVLRLQTRLEIVERVYPALDTNRVEKSLNHLLEILQSPEFTAKKLA